MGQTDPQGLQTRLIMISPKINANSSCPDSECLSQYNFAMENTEKYAEIAGIAAMITGTYLRQSTPTIITFHTIKQQLIHHIKTLSTHTFTDNTDNLKKITFLLPKKYESVIRVKYAKIQGKFMTNLSTYL